MEYFGYFTGMLTMIRDFWTEAQQPSGCYKLMSVVDRYGNMVNFVVSPTTYFVDWVTLTVGDLVTGFYDAMAPVPLIYPPQYRAIVMAKFSSHQNVKVDYFNSQLISSDGALKLNISPTTQILLKNEQRFTGSLANRSLVVVYGPTTRSIPAQTTPYKITVLCE
ncbi:MAG: hypothetical protein AB2421_10455 [Thermotaleaceae bacterium]